MTTSNCDGAGPLERAAPVNLLSLAGGRSQKASVLDESISHLVLWPEASIHDLSPGRLYHNYLRAWAFGTIQTAKRRGLTVDPLIIGAMSDGWSILYSHGSGMGPDSLQQKSVEHAGLLIGVNNCHSFVPHIVPTLFLRDGGGHGRSDSFDNPNFIAKLSLSVCDGAKYKIPSGIVFRCHAKAF